MWVLMPEGCLRIRPSEAPLGLASGVPYEGAAVVDEITTSFMTGGRRLLNGTHCRVAPGSLDPHRPASP